MPVWIDPPMWPAHGRLWSHVISDTSLEELHDFAARAGVPRRSFEGDHYDIPAERHTEVVRAGATATSANDLARRLAASGLRFRKLKGEWPLGRFVDGLPAVGGPHVLDVIASPHEPPASSGASVVLVTEPDGWLLLVRSVGRDGWAPPGGKRDRGEGLRQSAVRELVEETGLQVDPARLEPVGYERITIAPGGARAPWDDGHNHIAVYGVVIQERLTVASGAEDVTHAEWFARSRAAQLCGDQAWWPLVERWLERVDRRRGGAG